jgi:hypothetical protein
MTSEAGTGCNGTAPIKISVSGPGLSVEVAAAGATINIEIAGGSPTCSGTAASSSDRPDGPTYSAAARGISILRSDSDQKALDRPVIVDDDDFEVIDLARAEGYRVEEEAPSPFLSNKMPELAPAKIYNYSGKLQAIHNNARGYEGLTSGFQRCQLAYLSGRQAASYMRGEEPILAPSKFTIQRSPTVYVVLKGAKQGAEYPIVEKTFSAFKAHVFEDHQKSRPTSFVAKSVGHAFYSECEARAFCIGAGMSGLP